jgi:predicted RNase H-like HicB family nuclease
LAIPPVEVGGEIVTFTAVYIAVPEGFVAFVEELPGANAQGSTLEEVRDNLREAVELVLETNRELAQNSLAGQAFTKEPFPLSAP